MNISSRSTEGLPNQCPVCGKKVWVAPSVPPGDATCPHCGSLLWFPDPPASVHDVIRRLAQLGAIVETDDQGEVQAVRFSGSGYDDSIVPRLAMLKGVPFIDVRNTNISREGVKRLRDSLPDAIVEY